ncbi:MAG TPA: histidine kinase [Roseateles sp.]
MSSAPARREWPTYAGGTLAICVVVGLLNYLLRGGQFWHGMLYSFTVGVQISAFISLLTHGLAALLRRRHGDRLELRHGWVGWAWLIPCIVVGSLAGYGGGLWLGDLITGGHSNIPWQITEQRAALSITFTVLVSVLATWWFFSLFKINTARMERAHAERQAAEARLALLQSQLEPHMLFNTLAHLRVLIKLQPDAAQQMLDRLIDYLRATLQASRATEHPLADEFERLSDYLALMQLRMGERLRVRLELPAELGGIAIPPLLLQPLVENAVKHGLEPHVDGGELRVSAARQAGRLVLEVADDGVGVGSGPAAPGTGFGLAQVRERLAQRYGGAASFSLGPQAGGGSIARLEIPA